MTANCEQIDGMFSSRKQMHSAVMMIPLFIGLAEFGGYRNDHGHY